MLKQRASSRGSRNSSQSKYKANISDTQSQKQRLQGKKSIINIDKQDQKMTVGSLNNLKNKTGIVKNKNNIPLPTKTNNNNKTNVNNNKVDNNNKNNTQNIEKNMVQLDLQAPPQLLQRSNKQTYKEKIGKYFIVDTIACQRRSNIYLVELEKFENQFFALKQFHEKIEPEQKLKEEAQKSEQILQNFRNGQKIKENPEFLEKRIKEIQKILQNQKKIQNEIESLQKIDNNYVVKIIDDFIYQDQQCIVMEYCDGGNLLQLLKKKRVLNEFEAINILKEIMYGLTEIHKQEVIHRNLKLENILFKKGQIKIGGFGISRQLDEDAIAFSQIGTQQYLSPELALGTFYDNRLDVWQLGVILFVMLFHGFPFGNHSSQVKQAQTIDALCSPQFNLAKSLEKIKNPQKISSNMEKLFQDIFTISYQKRISVLEMWKHPVFRTPINMDLPDLYNNVNIDEYDILTSKKPATFYQFSSYKNGSLNSNFKTIEGFYAQTQQQNEVFVQKDQIQNEDGMLLSSKILALNGMATSSDARFVKHVEIYNFQIARYNLLIDQYQVLKNNMKFQLSLSHQQLLSFRYFILKSALFYMKWVNLILEKQINEFNLPHFDQFIESAEFQQYLNIVDTDINKYEQEFSEAYQKIIECDFTMEKQISQAIEPQVQINYKNKYAEMPDGLKLPFRAVMLGLFGKLYEQAQNYINCKAKLNIDIQDIFERKIFSQNEGKLRLRYCLRLLITCTINRIMEFQKFKVKTKIDNFEFVDYLKWLHQVKNIEEEIEHIFTKYYPQFNYKNMNSYHFI